MDELALEMLVLGTRRHELPRIPEVVLREALANALAHRSYQTAGTAGVARRPARPTTEDRGHVSIRRHVDASNVQVVERHGNGRLAAC